MTPCWPCSAVIMASKPVAVAAGTAPRRAYLGRKRRLPPWRRCHCALTASLAQKGVSSDTAQRALLAYQRSMTLPATVLAAAQ